MIEAPHYSAAGASKKAVALPEALFDGTVNQDVLHRAVITFLSNQRQGTSNTLTRIEVSGGNQKPKTKDLAALIKKLDATGKKVLVLTATDSHNVYLSGRNIPDVHVMLFADATAYEILWAQTVVVEIGALDEGAAKQDAKEASPPDA